MKGTSEWDEMRLYREAGRPGTVEVKEERS